MRFEFRGLIYRGAIFGGAYIQRGSYSEGLLFGGGSFSEFYGSLLKRRRKDKSKRGSNDDLQRETTGKLVTQLVFAFLPGFAAGTR